MKVTEEQVREYLGSSATVDSLISLLTELVNGKYLVEDFANDIVSLIDEEN